MKIEGLYEILTGPEAPYFSRASGGGGGGGDEERENYRRWLAERGDERAELFAIEDALLRDDFTEREAAIVRAEQILAMSARNRGWWSLLSRTSAIRNCGSASGARPVVRFAFECPRTWESLGPTADASTRHCSTCEKLVHLCRSRDEAEARARRGECITIASSEWARISNAVVSSSTGRPDPIAMWADRVFPDDRGEG